MSRTSAVVCRRSEAIDAKSPVGHPEERPPCRRGFDRCWAVERDQRRGRRDRRNRSAAPYSPTEDAANGSRKISAKRSRSATELWKTARTFRWIVSVPAMNERSAPRRPGKFARLPRDGLLARSPIPETLTRGADVDRFDIAAVKPKAVNSGPLVPCRHPHRSARSHRTGAAGGLSVRSPVNDAFGDSDSVTAEFGAGNSPRRCERHVVARSNEPHDLTRRG
jgi:hypothetical protein